MKKRNLETFCSFSYCAVSWRVHSGHEVWCALTRPSVIRYTADTKVSTNPPPSRIFCLAMLDLIESLLSLLSPRPDLSRALSLRSITLLVNLVAHLRPHINPARKLANNSSRQTRQPTLSTPSQHIQNVRLRFRRRPARFRYADHQSPHRRIAIMSSIHCERIVLHASIQSNSS